MRALTKTIIKLTIKAWVIMVMLYIIVILIRG
jgi:hypothetical protein